MAHGDPGGRSPARRHPRQRERRPARRLPAALRRHRRPARRYGGRHGRDHPAGPGHPRRQGAADRPGTGEAAPGNPFAGQPGAEARVWTYGHRNVQGLAVRPGSGQVYATEHGSYRDDEVTLLRPGGNGGWNPVGSGGYDDRVPMTDPSLPDVMLPSWASGDPTIATSGSTFLTGPRWGESEGLLLLAVLKGQGVLALRLDENGALLEQFRLPELEGVYGRIRAVQQGGDGR